MIPRLGYNIKLINKVRPEYVTEAAQLIRKSIIHVETGDVVFDCPKDFTRNNHSDSEDEDESLSTVDIDSKIPAKSQGAKLAISFEKYSQIAQMIVLHLSDLQSGLFISWVETIGEKQGDIVAWYLNQMSEQIAATDLEEETKLVRKVIGHMITKDIKLLIVQESTKGDLDDRLITVHPNYDPSSRK